MRNGGSDDPQNSIFPDDTLIKKWTSKRPVLNHRDCVSEGKMRNGGSDDPQNSIFPEDTLIKKWAPKRPVLNHQELCVRRENAELK